MNQERAISRETASFVVQVTVLFILSFLALETWFDTQTDRTFQEYTKTASDFVKTLTVRTDPDLFIRSRILPLLSPSRTGKLKGWVSKLRKKWDLRATLFAFDRQGKLAFTFPRTAEKTKLMETVYQGLVCEDRNEVNRLRKPIDRKTLFAFGTGRDLEYLRESRGKIIDVFSDGKPGILAWNRGKTGGVIIYVPTLPSPEKIFDVAATTLDRPCSFRGMGRTGDPAFRDLGGSDNPLAAKAFAGLAATQRQSGVFAGIWWTFLQTIGGRIVYAAFSPPPEPYMILRSGLRLGGTFFLAIMVFLLVRFRIAERIRLRRALISLFLVSALIPLFGLALGSLDLAEVFQSVMGSRIQAIEDEALQNVIQEFDNFLASSSAGIRNITSIPWSGKDDPETRRRAKMLMDRGLLDILILRDAAGKILFSNTLPYSEGRETMIQSVSRRAIERFQPNRLGEAKYEGNPMTDRLVRADDMGFSTLLNQSGRLQIVMAGTKQSLMFFQPLPSGTGPVAFVEGRLSLEKAVFDFLRQKVKTRITADGVVVRLFALDTNSCRWLIKPIPAIRRQLGHLAFSAWASGQPQTSRIEHDGVEGFAVAIRSGKLGEGALVAFYPDSILVERSREMLRKLAGGAITFLFLIGLMGSVLSQLFLAPLRFLEDGVAALGKRNFDFRLPSTGRDEIGNLFGAFNEMMGESHDLQLAKSVQEGLIPREFPVVEGYSIAGRVNTASDLGGDCLDCFLLQDGRLVFLVGDIAGHGVGSALLMAFSRAVTFHWSMGGSLTPAALAFDLDEMLRGRKGSRLFMGVVCGILDPRDHSLEIVVRGHIFPLLIRRDGSSEWVGKACYPLGIGPRPPNIESIRIRFDPGDHLLCTTDGFVEAINHARDPVGYDHLQSWAVETRRPEARDWTEALLAKHEAWCRRKPDDDLTLLALIRQEALR